MQLFTWQHALWRCLSEGTDGCQIEPIRFHGRIDPFAPLQGLVNAVRGIREVDVEVGGAVRDYCHRRSEGWP
jgi:hypothetical protein